MANNRNRVLEQIKTSLALITIANGYNTDVKTVTRLPQPMSTYNDTDFPVLMVSDIGIEAPTDISDPSNILHTLLIEIVGYFKDTTESLSENYNKLIADIWKVVYSPITFGTGNARYADAVELVGLETLGEAPPEIIFRVQLSVQYYFDKNAP